MLPDSTSLVSSRHGTFRVKSGFLSMYLIYWRLRPFHVTADSSPCYANLTANKRPERQILAFDLKLLSKKDLKSLGVSSGSDCVGGASLNGDRFNACGISEDTLLWATRSCRPLPVSGEGRCWATNASLGSQYFRYIDTCGSACGW